MNYHYQYQCTQCRLQFDAEIIESNLNYLCPKCGSIKKNEPLNGVLKIIYNYDKIKSQIKKHAFLKNHSGRFWEYLYLWPLNYSKNKILGIDESIINKLSLSVNPISEINYDNNSIYIFDDSRNPTLSYKDRASILVVLKAIQLGIKEISTASTGNAGSSLAGICSRLGIKSHIFVPKTIPESKRIQIQSYGSNIYLVDGDYDQSFDLCLEISKQKNWYNRNTAFNPLTIEGKKSAAYDMFISLNGSLPDNIFISVGDGVIISGIYKGLKELSQLGWIDKLPQLIAVQAKGSAALIEFIEKGKFKYKPAHTVADSISAGAPRNLHMAAKAVSETNGFGIIVSDDEILKAQKILAQVHGILAEPAAAASFAGYMKSIKSKNDLTGKSMLMITGNGLKDISSLERWNEIPNIKSNEKWREDLL